MRALCWFRCHSWRVRVPELPSERWMFTQDGRRKLVKITAYDATCRRCGTEKYGIRIKVRKG